ncbi:hypothetical protein BgiMline_030439 [Biomphalaria glabrata]
MVSRQDRETSRQRDIKMVNRQSWRNIKTSRHQDDESSRCRQDRETSRQRDIKMVNRQSWRNIKTSRHQDDESSR